MTRASTEQAEVLVDPMLLFLLSLPQNQVCLWNQVCPRDPQAELMVLNPSARV
jgi:hypothetical protein